MGLKSLFTKSSSTEGTNNSKEKKQAFSYFRKKKLQKLASPKQHQITSQLLKPINDPDTKRKVRIKDKSKDSRKNTQGKLTNPDYEEEEYLHVEVEQLDAENNNNGDYRKKVDSKRHGRKARGYDKARTDDEIQWTMPHEHVHSKKEIISVRMSAEGDKDVGSKKVKNKPEAAEEQRFEPTKKANYRPDKKKTLQIVNTPTGRKFSPKQHEQYILRINKLKRTCDYYKSQLLKQKGKQIVVK